MLICLIHEYFRNPDRRLIFESCACQLEIACCSSLLFCLLLYLDAFPSLTRFLSQKKRLFQCLYLLVVHLLAQKFQTQRKAPFRMKSEQETGNYKFQGKKSLAWTKGTLVIEEWTTVLTSPRNSPGII